jgi:hypothetical protein
VLPAGPWLESLVLTDASATDVEVVARAVGGPLDGCPAIVRRGRLVAMGASSTEAWTALIARITQRSPEPAHLEVFERAGRRIAIDHRALRVDGIGRGAN